MYSFCPATLFAQSAPHSGSRITRGNRALRGAFPDRSKSIQNSYLKGEESVKRFRKHVLILAID